MFFTYTYRDRDGLLKSSQLEAESRADAFAKLKGQNILVVSLTQGHGNVVGKNASPVDFKKHAIVIASVGLLLSIGLGVWLWPSSEKSDLEKKTPPPKVKSEKPTRKEVSRPKVQPAEQAKGAETAKAEVVTNAPPEVKPVPPGHIRLPTGLQLRYRLPPEGMTRKLIANGEIWEIDHEGNAKNITPPPLFKKPFERTLSALAHRDGIVLPDVIAGYAKEDILKWCSEPTEFFDDDTPEDLKKRQTVAEMKSMVSDYINAGGDFKDFVQEVQAFSAKERRFHATGLSEVVKAIQDGRIEDARQTVEAMNKLTEENGYSPLMIPARYRELLNRTDDLQK